MHHPHVPSPLGLHSHTIDLAELCDILLQKTYKRKYQQEKLNHKNNISMVKGDPCTENVFKQSSVKERKNSNGSDFYFGKPRRKLMYVSKLDVSPFLLEHHNIVQPLYSGVESVAFVFDEGKKIFKKISLQMK